VCLAFSVIFGVELGHYTRNHLSAFNVRLDFTALLKLVSGILYCFCSSCQSHLNYGFPACVSEDDITDFIFIWLSLLRKLAAVKFELF